MSATLAFLAAAAASQVVASTAATTPAAASDPWAAKVLLALVGAVLAWGLRALWDEWTLRARWRRLSPLTLRRIALTAIECSKTFDARRLETISQNLAAAEAAATDLVAAGVRTAYWMVLLEKLLDCQDVVDGARHEQPANQAAALERVRDAGKQLMALADVPAKEAAVLLHRPEDPVPVERPSGRFGNG